MINQTFYVVMYHYVRDLKNNRYPNIKGLDYSLFKEQIDFFNNNFNVVTMEHIMEAFEGKSILPDKALLLTFDDGYIDHYSNVFPVLNEYGMQGSFFVSGKTFMENKLLDVNKIHFILASTEINILLRDLYQNLDYYRGREFDYPSNEELFHEYAIANRFDTKEVIFFKRILQTVLPEKLRNQISSEIFKDRIGISEDVFARELYMNYDQIKCMKKSGMFIGLHGYDHYWLNKLDEDIMIEDIEKALGCMQEFIDINSWVINYPYGSYSESVVDYVSKKGCKLGLTTDVLIADTNCNRYLIPRLDTNDFPPKSKNYIRFIKNNVRD